MTARPSRTAGVPACEAPPVQERTLKQLLASAALVLAAASLLAADDALPAPAAARALAGRRVKRFSSLTGAWTGVYRYSGARGAESVPFNARLEESGESFTGDIDEPNTYADPAAPRLYAAVNGTRRNLEVSFVKTMDGTGGVTHSIHYTGAADPDLSHIDGVWRLASGYSGTFFMERAGVEAEAAVERSASATG